MSKVIVHEGVMAYSDPDPGSDPLYAVRSRFAPRFWSVTLPDDGLEYAFQDHEVTRVPAHSAGYDPTHPAEADEIVCAYYNRLSPMLARHRKSDT